MGKILDVSEISSPQHDRQKNDSYSSIEDCQSLSTTGSTSKGMDCSIPPAIEDLSVLP
jgi:hypothetical protein